MKTNVYCNSQFISNYESIRKFADEFSDNDFSFSKVVEMKTTWDIIDISIRYDHTGSKDILCSGPDKYVFEIQYEMRSTSELVEILEEISKKYGINKIVTKTIKPDLTLESEYSGEIVIEDGKWKSITVWRYPDVEFITDLVSFLNLKNVLIDVIKENPNSISLVNDIISNDFEYQIKNMDSVKIFEFFNYMLRNGKNIMKKIKKIIF